MSNKRKFCYSDSMKNFFPAAILLTTTLLSAQTFKPKTVQFVGAVGYNQAEMQSIVQLSAGTNMEVADLNAKAQKIVDTGMFTDVSYTFDGESLTFSVKPSPNLYPLHTTNFPIPLSQEVLTRIHAKAPLFHDKLPGNGQTLEDVRVAFESELALLGIKGHVVASPYTDPILHIVTAMDLSVDTPQVVLDTPTLNGISADLVDGAQKLAVKIVGKGYDRDNSLQQIQEFYADYLIDHGYAAAKVAVVAGDKPKVTADTIVVPITVNVDQGLKMRVGMIRLSSHLKIPITDLDKALNLKAGEQAKSSNLHAVWQLVADKYKAKGYLECKVVPTPSISESLNTVDYLVDVISGPQYTFGQISFEGFTDQAVTQMQTYWKLRAGAPLDAIYVQNFFLKFAAQNESLTKQFANVKVAYYMNTDTKTHIVNVLYKQEQ